MFLWLILIALTYYQYNHGFNLFLFIIIVIILLYKFFSSDDDYEGNNYEGIAQQNNYDDPNSIRYRPTYEAPSKPKKKKN